jgi:hypothetical protein
MACRVKVVSPQFLTCRRLGLPGEGSPTILLEAFRQVACEEPRGVYLLPPLSGTDLIELLRLAHGRSHEPLGFARVSSLPLRSSFDPRAVWPRSWTHSTPRGTLMVSVDACINIAISRLPFVALKTHVMTM